MPGSPATKTMLPGTMPPPSTLFNSVSAVVMNLFSSALYISFNRNGFHDLFHFIV